MSVVSVANAKTHIGMDPSDTSQDDRFQTWLDGLEEATWNWLGRYRVPGAGTTPHNPFEKLETTEYYDGGERQFLVLKRRPVLSVAGVWVDQHGHYGQSANAFPDPETKWQAGESYALKNSDESEANGGILVAFSGSIPSWQGQPQRYPAWPRGMGNIKVTYTAGYTVFPPDVEVAILMLFSLIRNAAKRGVPLDSETIGRYSYKLLSEKKPPGSSDYDDLYTAKSMLTRYRELNL